LQQKVYKTSINNLDLLTMPLTNGCHDTAFQVSQGSV